MTYKLSNVSVYILSNICIFAYFTELVTTDASTTFNNKENCLEAKDNNLTDGNKTTCCTFQQQSDEVPIDILPVIMISQSCILSNGSVALGFTMEKNQSCEELNQTVYVWRYPADCQNSNRLVPCQIGRVHVMGREVTCEVICPCSLNTMSCEIVLARRLMKKDIKRYVTICEIHLY